MDTSHIEKLFIEYEKAFNDLDVARSAQFFSDHFISAGPKGTIAQGKDDLVKKAAEATEFYKSVGQKSAKIISKNIIPISNEYALVTVHWGVGFKKMGNELVEFDVTYIVQLRGKKPLIILFITHQDEEEAMKKLGLLEPAKMSTH